MFDDQSERVAGGGEESAIDGGDSAERFGGGFGGEPSGSRAVFIIGHPESILGVVEGEDGEAGAGGLGPVDLERDGVRVAWGGMGWEGRVGEGGGRGGGGLVRGWGASLGWPGSGSREGSAAADEGGEGEEEEEFGHLGAPR